MERPPVGSLDAAPAGQVRRYLRVLLENREFEPYRPADDGDRLREAPSTSPREETNERVVITPSGLEVQPKPYQAEMLEQLEAERQLHDRHRNLIVAATGTGKTVVAALDYRRLRELHGRNLSLLFVAPPQGNPAAVPSDVPGGAHRTDIRGVTGRRGGAEEVASRLRQHSIPSPRPGWTALRRIASMWWSSTNSTHAEAKSYRRLLDHVAPMELLG